MRALALAVAVSVALLTGCAAAVKVAESPAATVICQGADAASTVAVLKAGGHEQNPIWKAVIEKAGLTGFLIGKAALTIGLIAWTSKPEGLATGVNVASCLGAVHNLGVLKKQ